MYTKVDKIIIGFTLLLSALVASAIIGLCLLFTIDVNNDTRPFEKRYDSNLLIEGFIDYKEPIYSCLFDCIMYAEFTYEDASNLFENNTNYEKVTKENYRLLKKLTGKFASFSQYEDVLSFKPNEQVKIDDLFHLDYAVEREGDIHQFKIYYYDKAKDMLYYFSYSD